MGRPPSNGAPSFRFNPTEVAQMEAILKKHEGHVPPRDLLVALAHRFSQSPERAGKMVVQMKQVWNWFQNRRYALRAKSVEPSGKPGTSPVTAPQAMNVPSVPQQMAVSSGPHVAGNTSEAPTMEYEAKSARDGAWYDVQMFISLRSLDTENPEVLVRFAGFGPEEDEWVNIVKHVRPRSLPCEASECIVVCPGDLILCFQEGKEQALYFDAHVLDAQRRRHDVRGCRCRFLVRYDHDQSEEIVPLRKICRRPDTDYRLQQLNNAANDAPAPTSAPVGPSKPVVSTSTTALGTTNPSASAATVSQSSIIGARPSVRPPPASAPTLVQALNVRPATTPIPTSVPTSTRATSFGTSTPAVRPPMSDQKKAENVNPAQISMPDQKVASVNPAQVSVPVLKKAEVEQVPVSSPTLAESVNSAPVSLPVPKKAEAEQVSVFDPKMAETVNPAQISVTEPKKVEAEQVLVCIPKMAESVDPAYISVTDPKKPEAEQVSVCIPKMAESVDPAHISVTDPKKAEAEQVLVHTPKIAESVNPVLISAIDPKTAENVVPVQISIPGPKMAESVSVMPTPVVVTVPEVNKVEVVSPTPVLAPLSGPSKVETNSPSSAPVQVPVPVPETIKVEGDNAAVVSVTELNKVASDIPVSVCGSSQVETVIPAFAPVQVPETNEVAGDIPVYVPEPNEVVSDMSVSIPEPNKAEGDISITAATEPNKVEGDIPASAPEPNKTEGDIPVSAPAASVNLGTSDSEAGAQANISTTGAVTKILEANEADNINVPEEQLSGNPAITVPGPEPHPGTEPMTTVTGNTERTLGN